MLPEISEISRRRKLLGLTQKELAQLTMASQSFIAKLESGKINPSYRHVKNVFEILNSMEKKHEDEITARRISHKRVHHVSESDSVAKAAKLMRKHNISQLPVMSGGHITGSITERTIVYLISKGKKDLHKIKVSDEMEEPFPTIQENTPLSVISAMLNHNAAVLIISSGKVNGIVTKADLIKTIK